MPAEYRMRMGDGGRAWMTKEQIRADVEDGVANAVDCAEVPALTEDDITRIVDIMCEKGRTVSVEPGEEVILTQDGGELKLLNDSGSSSPALEMSRTAAIQVHERALGMDTFEVAYFDPSTKQVKPVIGMEMAHCQNVMANTVIPMLYMFMPNIGLYYQPTGPFGNPPDLMREFKIDEAMEAGTNAMNAMRDDIIFIGERILSTGIDGLDFDTTASGGTSTSSDPSRPSKSSARRTPTPTSRWACPPSPSWESAGCASTRDSWPPDSIRTSRSSWPRPPACPRSDPSSTPTPRSPPHGTSPAPSPWSRSAPRSPRSPPGQHGDGGRRDPDVRNAPIDAITRADKCMIEIAHVDGL